MVFSEVGGSLEYRGGHLERREGNHDKCGGKTMKTMGEFSTVEAYREYRGGYL